jgi:hypothetical protein
MINLPSGFAVVQWLAWHPGFAVLAYLGFITVALTAFGVACFRVGMGDGR